MNGENPAAGLRCLLVNSHLAVPEDLPPLIVEHAAALGAIDAALYLVDCDQIALVPVPDPNGARRQEVAIDATIAGRAFRDITMQRVEGEGGEWRQWVPVLDGAERLGVLELAFPGPVEVLDDDLKAFASIVAELVVSKNLYGDLFYLVRRRRPMSVAAELAWQLLPPLTFGTERVVIAGGLVPTYDIGGDSFDYAVDAGTARVAVFDAMGHGLEAGLLATVAVAAYRNSRRRRLSLADTVVAVDEVLASQFGTERFVTAVLAELDLATGQLRWSLAGHPPPLLFRGGRLVKPLDGNVGLPLGLGVHGPELEEVLEPGDQLVFHTDGVVEARSPGGEFFGLARLVDLVGRASSSRSPAPEVLRRLVQAVVNHQAGDFQDDATLVLVDWQGGLSKGLQVS